MEIDRFSFLLNRDGASKTKDFYIQALGCYQRASELALVPRMDNEARMPARGKEWAETYRKAALDCEAMLTRIKAIERIGKPRFFSSHGEYR